MINDSFARNGLAIRLVAFAAVLISSLATSDSLVSQERAAAKASFRPLDAILGKRQLQLEDGEFVELAMAGTVTAIQFSHDGKRLAAASADGEIVIWDTHELEVPKRVMVLSTEPRSQPSTIAFSSDGRFLAAGGGGRVWRWDLETREHITEILPEASGEPTWLAFDEDSLVVADDRSFVHRLETETLQPVSAWSRAYMPDAIVYSPNGRLVARVDAGRRLTVWDLRSRAPTSLSLPTHDADVFAFSPDGERLVLAGLDWAGKTSAEKQREAEEREAQEAAENMDPAPTDTSDEDPWPMKDGGMWWLDVESGKKRRLRSADDRHIRRSFFSLDGDCRVDDFGKDGVVIRSLAFAGRSVPREVVLPGDNQPDGLLAVAGGPLPKIARRGGAANLEYWHRVIPPQQSRMAATADFGRPRSKALTTRREKPADDFVTCTVFYGTNRTPRQSTGQIWLDEFRLFFQRDLGVLLAAIAGLLLVVSVVLMALIRSFTWGRALALTLLFTLLVMGVPGAHTFFVIRRDTASPSAFYGNKRGELLYGSCEVTIPNSHVEGKLETPLFVLTADPSEHILLRDVDPVNGRVFLERLQREASGKEVFVFIHGYNVSFEDAVRRTAQMAYDLKFPGVPIFFSWPSKANLLGYVEDANNSDLSGVQLAQFLTDVERHSGADRIHLIAHSMGTRVLSNALRDLGRARLDQSKFREIILAAPDIDAEYFKRSIAPAIVPDNPGLPNSRHVTLYASSKDTALEISERVNGYRRAGDAEDLLVYPGLDTIDVSDFHSEPTGHSYYGDLPDLFEILQSQRPPGERRGPEDRKSLTRGQGRELPYWKHKRAEAMP